MKLTKLNLRQLIKEELDILAEADPELARALMGTARAPEPEPEDTRVDLGEEGPTKEDLIKAALLLDIDPITSRNRMVLYNIGTLLRNKPDADPQDIVKAIQDAWEEDELIGGDEPLQETLRKLWYAKKR